MGLDRFAFMVQHPTYWSYYNDAREFASLREVLDHWAETVPHLGLHTRSKPPGITLVCAVAIKVLGDHWTTALLIGVTVMFLTALSGPATYFLGKSLGLCNETALLSAALTATAPSVVLMTPYFDGVYLPLGCLLLILWIMAVKRNSTAIAMGYALTLAIICFFSPVLLALGTFIVGWSAHYCLSEQRIKSGVLRIARIASIAVAAFIAIHLLLAVVTGYDPIETYVHIFKYQNHFNTIAKRTYLSTLIWDPLDYALAVGYVPMLVALIALLRQRRNWLIWTCMITVALMPGLGILRHECARQGIFLIPLVMIPAAVELARWKAWRLIVLGLFWLLLILIALNFDFVYIKIFSGDLSVFYLWKCE